MNKESTWRFLAHQILDAYRATNKSKKITQASLSQKLGISRQTLWRDEELRNKLIQINEEKTHNKAKRRVNFRIEELTIENSMLRKENGLLIQCLILSSKLMRQNGLDPSTYMAESASLLSSAFPGIAPAELYESFKEFITRP